MNKHYLNGKGISENKARCVVERCMMEQGYDPVEIRDIWEQANGYDGEEFRDMLFDFGVEIIITH